MGNQAPSGSGASKSRDEAPEFLCSVGEYPDGKSVIVRMEREALVVLDSKTRAAKWTFPYHGIMCWGQSSTSFMIRVFEASLLADGEADRPTIAELAAAGLSDSELGVRTIRFLTSMGPLMEETIMSQVVSLMADMDARGVTSEELHALQANMEEDPDHALSMLRQLSLTRRFPVRDAMDLVRRVGDLSPFDKVEAAVVLYPALIDKNSFKLILEEFGEEDDRDNVCHRLRLDLREVMG